MREKIFTNLSWSEMEKLRVWGRGDRESCPGVNSRRCEVAFIEGENICNLPRCPVFVQNMIVCHSTIATLTTVRPLSVTEQ